MSKPLIPASVERKPLEPEDRALLGEAHDTLRTLEAGSVLLAILFAACAWYIGKKGETTGAAVCGCIAAFMLGLVICFEVFICRDVRRAMKEVIRGVIVRRKKIELRFNVICFLYVGQINVAVPPDVYECFEEGQAVCIERTCGSNSFLRIQHLADQAKTIAK